MEARRDEFRNYLETSGAISALTNVLIKLFELQEKPEDSVRYICQNINGMWAELEQENADLRQQLAGAAHHPQVPGSARSSHSSRVRFSTAGCANDAEKLTKGLDLLQQDEACNSALKQFLTTAIIEQLADIRTEPHDASLFECVEYGLRDHETATGILAADADCFNAFSTLFDPILRHLHRFDDPEWTQPDVDWGDFNALTDPDPTTVFIQKCKIQCYRSLPEFPFFLKMSDAHFGDVMEVIRTFAKDNEQEAAFHELATIDDETKQRLSASTTMGEPDFNFDECQATWEATQFSRQWPTGRAVYFTNENEMAIRVNHRTHVQFGLVQDNGDLKSLIGRMSECAKAFDEKVPCVRHEKYGWLTPLPQLVGTAIEVSAVVMLIHLPKDHSQFVDLLTSVNLKVVDGVDKESSELYELRNIRSFGVTEYQLMEEFCAGLAKVIEAEMAAQEPSSAEPADAQE